MRKPPRTVDEIINSDKTVVKNEKTGSINLNLKSDNDSMNVKQNFSGMNIKDDNNEFIENESQLNTDMEELELESFQDEGYAEWELVVKTLDPDSRQRLYLSQLKHYLAKVNEDKETYKTVYGTIWNRITLEGQQLLEQQQGFRSIKIKCDAIKLWNMISEKFLKMDNYNHESIASFNYERFYHEKLSQFQNENISSFKARFVDAINGFKLHGLTEPSESQAALHFINKLDEKRFAQFKKEYMRDMKRGIEHPPVNIQDALDKVNKFMYNNPSHHYKGSNVHSRNTAVFATTGKTLSNSEKDKNGTAAKDNNPNSDSTKSEDKSHAGNDQSSKSKGERRCYLCGDPGHIRPQCPQKKNNSQSNKSHQYVVKSSFYCFNASTNEVKSEDVKPGTITTRINIAECHKESPSYLLLDSCAQTSVVCTKDRVSNLRESNTLLVIEGVSTNDKNPSTRLIGELHPFGTVYVCEDIRVNVLSMAEQRDKAKRIQYYHEQDHFEVECSNGSKYIFARIDSMYGIETKCLDENIVTTVATATVRERENKYHKHEVKRAKEVMRVSRCLGFEGKSGLLHIIRTGAFVNLGITYEDVYRAFEIYGAPIPYLKGTSTRKKVQVTSVSNVTLNVERPITITQSVHVDVMHIEGVSFIVSVSKPMNLTMAEELEKNNAQNILSVVQNTIDTYRTFSYDVGILIFDCDNTLIAALSRIPNVKFSTVGAGMHVKVIESKIRRIKEKTRCILHSIPFCWPNIWLKWVVYFAVKARNRIPVKGSGTVLSPVELLTGIKSDAKKDLRVAFGDYAQTREMDTNNTMAPRTRGCIALLPLGNLDGSVRFLDLKTLNVIVRTAWEPLPITDQIVEYINGLCDKKGRVVAKDPTITYGSGIVVEDKIEENGVEYIEEEPEDMLLNRTDELTDNSQEIIVDEEIVDQDGDDALLDETNDKEENLSIAQNNIDNQDDNDNDIENNTIGDEFNDTTQATATETDDEGADDDVRVSKYSGRVVRRSHFDKDIFDFKIPKKGSKKVNAFEAYKQEVHDAYVFNLTVRQGVIRYGDLAIESINKELRAMIELDVWEPIKLDDGNRNEIGGKLIKSKMFLKDKHNPDGSFDKLKARLVAGGHMQDRLIYNDTSSPTPAISSVFIIASIAASRGYTVATLDIGNAYINTPMKGPAVYMRLDKLTTEMLCDIKPEYVPFKQDNGEIIVKLKKALYGCIQSGKLWHDYMKELMLSVGFKANSVDGCVFNCGDEHDKLTVVIYVDDLLIVSPSAEEVENFICFIEGNFKRVTTHRGSKVSYLGMNFDFESVESGVEITMEGYINGLLDAYEITKTARTPANNNLFKNTDDTAIDDDMKKTLHSLIAKLLYVSHRVRFDIMLPVQYLTTRVNDLNRGDRNKAVRVLEYLKCEPQLGLKLRIGDEICVNLFADASYGVHRDGKSQSAGIVTIGNAPVIAKSTKQKIVTKSSTESELVCASDMVGLGYGVKDFLDAQGFTMVHVALHQDNTSTIAMMDNGPDNRNLRTRHINVRYFFIKERIDSGEVKVKYLPTEDMVADILTKPLQGGRFFRLRDMLLGSLVIVAKT